MGIDTEYIMIGSFVHFFTVQTSLNFFSSFSIIEIPSYTYSFNSYFIQGIIRNTWFYHSVYFHMYFHIFELQSHIEYYSHYYYFVIIDSNFINSVSSFGQNDICMRILFIIFSMLYWIISWFFSFNIIVPFCLQFLSIFYYGWRVIIIYLSSFGFILGLGIYCTTVYLIFKYLRPVIFYSSKWRFFFFKYWRKLIRLKNYINLWIRTRLNFFTFYQYVMKYKRFVRYVLFLMRLDVREKQIRAVAGKWQYNYKKKSSEVLLTQVLKLYNFWAQGEIIFSPWLYISTFIRIIYTLFISLFVFILKMTLRFLIKNWVVFKLFNFYLFLCFYGLFLLKRLIVHEVYVKVWRITIWMENWMAIYWYQDFHYMMSRALVFKPQLWLFLSQKIFFYFRRLILCYLLHC